jgi:hypothetical protein
MTCFTMASGGAVNSAGFLCETADNSVFTGDILNWVKRKISGTALVVADSLSHPLIFSRAKMQLEVGILMRRVSYDES